MPEPQTPDFQLFEFQRSIFGAVLIRNVEEHYAMEMHFCENWARLFGDKPRFYAYAHFDPVTNKFTFDPSREIIPDKAEPPSGKLRVVAELEE